MTLCIIYNINLAKYAEISVGINVINVAVNGRHGKN